MGALSLNSKFLIILKQMDLYSLAIWNLVKQLILFLISVSQLNSMVKDLYFFINLMGREMFKLLCAVFMDSYEAQER